MTIPKSWKVVASTSRFFPVESTVVLTRKSQDSTSFALEVDWVQHASLPLFDVTLPEEPPGTSRGDFFHPKAPTEQFDFSVTVSLGPKEKPYLFGVVSGPRQGIESGGTGVWVAEEQQPPRDPPDKST